MLLKYFKSYLAELLILLFILGNCYILVYKKDYFYPYNVIPAICLIVYFAIFNIEKLVFFLAFATPLSITLKELGVSEGLDLSLPTEPIMAGLMLLYLLNALVTVNKEKKFLNHPVSMIILAQLLWMGFTTCFSSDYIVSIKYLISRLWFIFSCYLIMPYIFKEKKNILNFIYCYSTSLGIVIIYTIYRHSLYNFGDKEADWVVDPFYNDHTAYGAALAMLIPLFVCLLFTKSISKPTKIILFAFLLLYLSGIILSFARAGWLSLLVAAGISFCFLLRIKLHTIYATIIALTIIFFTFQTEIFIALGRNNTDAEGGFSNNIESVSNISTDASNLERLNRWSCAWRMWQDKPILGWGPGTYMFKYAPYQLSKERTIISTNFGTNGNAHSEYLGPLAEQGLFGGLIVVILLLYTAHLGFKLYYSITNRDTRLLSLGLFLGLATYFVHGFLNNFLDSDKLSILFWGFLAALVCIEIYHNTGKIESKSE